MKTPEGLKSRPAEGVRGPEAAPAPAEIWTPLTENSQALKEEQEGGIGGGGLGLKYSYNRFVLWRIGY